MNRKSTGWRGWKYYLAWPIVTSVFCLALPMANAQVDPLEVKTVPWADSNPLVPHVTYDGKIVSLKGTSNKFGPAFEYAWDFGDGSPVAVGTVNNRWAISAKHSYSGATGTVFTARLTVRDTGTGETASRPYYVQMMDKTLEVESNIAIDEGLWYLHQAMNRFTDGDGLEVGDWLYTYGAGLSTHVSLHAVNVHAFEVNGYLATGNPLNPYTDTVRRGLYRALQLLTTWQIGLQTNPLGTFNPDTNGNGYAASVAQDLRSYQTGMFVDALIATGTPNMLAVTGQVASGANPGIRGRTYRDIVQDMTDSHNYCQYDSGYAGWGGGGWRYGCNDFPDNSANQWVAISYIPAERVWGIPVPQIVKDFNVLWLQNTQHPDGYFGYTDPWPVWGPFATTASGLVQMVFDGIHRGDVMWDKAETYMRNQFCNEGGPYNSVRDYYYGLFSFVKSLLLHDQDGDGVADPVVLLQSTTPGVMPIDWYSAEASKGAQCNGVARVLISDQYPDGYWWGNDVDGAQYPFETAFAIIMLNRTIFEAGAPVAVASAVPNPAVAGQIIRLDGSASFHQDSTKGIDSWSWDLDNNGTIDAAGPIVTTSFGAVGDYLVRLVVTDNGTPEKSAESVLTVRVTTPPLPPTADAGGPYIYCPQATPWFLDGRLSTNPDEGGSEPGMPGDTIVAYLWDLDGDGSYDDASGATPDVTAYMNGLGIGHHLVQLKVIDQTSVSYPSSGMTDLSDTDSAEVIVKSATDPECSCVDNLAARAKPDKVQLVWSDTGAHHYNIYRSTVAGGPYLIIGSTPSRYCTWLDKSVVPGATYYYVVREAQANSSEVCQSNEAMAKPPTRLSSK